MRVSSARYTTPKTYTRTSDVVDVEYVELDGVDAASCASDNSPAYQVQTSSNSSYIDATDSANNRYTSLTSYDEARVFNSQRGVEHQKNPYSQDTLADYKRRMLA